MENDYSPKEYFGISETNQERNLISEKQCKCCERVLPISQFISNRYGKKNDVCKECTLSKRRLTEQSKKDKLEIDKNPPLNPALVVFQSRELINELKARGYSGELKFTEVKITNIKL